MKTQPTFTESLQSGVGISILLVLAITFLYGFFDTAERSIAIVGFPIVAVLFVLYSALKFTNSRKKIGAIRKEGERILGEMAVELERHQK